MNRSRSALLALALLAALVGCREGDEERALAAYDAGDFDKAARLAAALASENNPRGYELQALLAAQGLGRGRDFAAAVSLIDAAIALDPSYRDSRARIDTLVERTAHQAGDAFAAEDWDRALALAQPLAAFGHETGASLTRKLVTGGYVALPGSAMAWRDFWNDCAGNTRRSDAERTRRAFAERCRGKEVVWDGTIAGRRSDALIFVRMDPGRPRARYDLTLQLHERPEAALAVAGRKVRFRGAIEARGGPAQPDRLIDAELLGTAPRSVEEEKQALQRARGKAAGACRRLLYDRFRGADAPEWTRTWRASLTEDERQRLRLYMFVAIESPPEAYIRDADGHWSARITGHVAVQAPNAQISSTSEFVALCRLDPAPENAPSRTLTGSMAFERLDPPRFTSSRS